jgi:CHASE2 domain-containing sensor protein
MKNIWAQSAAITFFVFFMMWAFSGVGDLKIFSAFDSFSQAFSDTELTDYVFSKFRNDPTVDERIVLVNIGPLSRGGVAQEIKIINQQKPRVVAYDALLSCEGNLRDSINCPSALDTLGNLMLSEAIQESDKFVLGEKLMQTDSLGQFDTNIADSLEIPDPEFGNFAHEGFVSLPTDATHQEDVKIGRTIWPQFMVNGKRELAFSVRIAMSYDSMKAEKILARNKEEEVINFRGNIEVMQFRLNSLKNSEIGSSNFATMFTVVDYDDVLNGNFAPDLFKDKIVMLGFMGAYLGAPSWEDKFFTPLNKKIGGRANPDMFGLVVHANAVAMILNEDYVNQLGDMQKYLIAFLVCFFTVILFIIVDEKLPAWYDALSVVIQLVELVILMAIILQVFSVYSFKLDLDLTLAATALVGPCYDIFKSLQNENIRQITKRKQTV